MILPYPLASSNIELKRVALLLFKECSSNNLLIVSSVINGASPHNTATVPSLSFKKSIAHFTACPVPNCSSCNLHPYL